VIRRRAFRGFSRLGFPRKNLCSCSCLIYFYLRGFVTSGIRASGFKIDSQPREISRCAPGAAPRFFWINICSFASSSSFAKVSHSCVSRDPIYQIDMVLATATHAFPFAICFRTIAVQSSC
jgi:hypothetical protein